MAAKGFGQLVEAPEKTKETSNKGFFESLAEGFKLGVQSGANALGSCMGLTGCRKDVLQPSANSACNVWNAGRASQLSPYRTEVWKDEFEGSDGSDCYSKQPVCLTTPISFAPGACLKQDYLSLSDLNKCNWAVMEGYDEWTNNGSSMYDPSQVSVYGGVLHLSFHHSPVARAQCSKSVSSASLGCPIQLGGVTSQGAPGFGVGGGRVEIRAKVAMEPAIWPALWAWANAGPGALATQELDILELGPKPGDALLQPLQTFHDYFPGVTGGDSSHGSTGVSLSPGDFHVYGVERGNDSTGDYIKFFVDDCYTRTIHNGDLDTGGRPMFVRSVDPMFLILNYNSTNDSMGYLGQLDGAEMAVDWVRVYQ
jgi:beta-glucanase (GH16 family)